MPLAWLRPYAAAAAAGFVLTLATAGAAHACTLRPGAAMFAYDRTAPLRVVRGPTIRGTETLETDLHFISEGRTIGATLVRPRRSTATPDAAILFVHWLGDPATTNRTEFLPDARALARPGITSLLVDAEWSRPDWFDFRTPATDACDTVAQVVALRRALDVLAGQDHIDARHVAYVGHDFGAMTGALLTAVDARPRYAVFMTPALSFWEWFLLGTPPADPGAYTRKMSALDLPLWLPHARFAGALLQFAKRDVYVSGATAIAIRNLVPNRDRTFARYDADHAMTVAAATADRRAWLLARLRH
jgi:dienelactone hydrolase